MKQGYPSIAMPSQIVTEERNMDLKVLLVAHVGYPWGGISQRYSDLLASSLSRKIDLAFFESSPNKRSASSTGEMNSQNVMGFFWVCFEYVQALRRARPSIVHIATAFGNSFLKSSILVLLARLAGSKVILAPHCSISVFVPKNRLLFRWMKYVLSLCDGMVVLSSEWQAIRQIAPGSHVVLLKNSINLHPYLQIERSLGSPDSEVEIFYLGHIGDEKGIMDLIRAAGLVDKEGIRGFRIAIYGEESHPGELQVARELAQGLGLDGQVTFSEPVFDAQKLAVFRDADIYVLPSHHEGLPISIIEAMAAGLPVIGTRVGGIPDLVTTGENGILVEPKNPAGLANALAALIADAHLRYSYGLQGRQKALENHDVENYVDKLVAFYREIQG
jgi:glycosyltransferase involved in cell wall biosynthesis